MIKQYERKFYEATFANTQILKAIQLTNRIVSKRIASKIYTSYLPEEFITPEGKFAGLFCLLSGFRKIRYNWKLGKNSEIVSIDFWIRKRKGIVKPDYSIDVQGISAPKLVDIIAKILLGDIEPEFQVITESIKHKEDFAPKTKGQKSSAITKAIGEWARSQDISDDKLENTRISVLWRDFQFWFKEKASQDIQIMSELTFRNYIIEYLKSRGIKNKFIRSIIVRNGNKEKIIVSDNASEAAYNNVEHLRMNLNDMRNLMESTIRAVTRDYVNSAIICGVAGFGKTTAVTKILQEEGMKIEIVNTIKNMSHLYGLFYNNNDKKSVIFFDDANEIFAKKYMGMVLAGLDDHNPRILNFPVEVGKTINLKKFNPNIEFVGKIIIATNLPKDKLPRAMSSRTVPIEIKANTSEIIDDIRINLENVMPEVPLKDKQLVLDFIENLGKNIKFIDFRRFKRCLIFYLTGDPSWKKQVFTILS
jgi:hypothetical protein